MDRFEADRGISAATNAALKIATGPYFGLVDNDDMLRGDALEKSLIGCLRTPGVDLLYTDECKIDRDDVVDELFHKPDWSPLLLLNSMYTGHLSVYRKTLVESIGSFVPNTTSHRIMTSLSASRNDTLGSSISTNVFTAGE